MNIEEQFNKDFPFENFGQFREGTIDIRVFDQDKWWVNYKGEPYLLENTDQETLSSILEFLFNNAEFLYELYITNKLISLIASDIDTESTNEELAKRLAEMDALTGVKPHQWLASSLLSKKLNALLD